MNQQSSSIINQPSKALNIEKDPRIEKPIIINCIEINRTRVITSYIISYTKIESKTQGGRGGMKLMEELSIPSMMHGTSLQRPNLLLPQARMVLGCPLSLPWCARA